MGKRISRCVELLEQDQAIYYDGPHSGHVLTHAQGSIDAATWADYMNVGMEHGAFDMAGLADYMRGMADAFTQQQEEPETTQLSFEERFALLVDRQWNWRQNQALARRLHGAKLRGNACVEEIDYRAARGFDGPLFMGIDTRGRKLMTTPRGCCCTGHHKGRSRVGSTAWIRASSGGLEPGDRSI